MFEFPLLDPRTGIQLNDWTVAGKIDCLTVDGPIEHKTSSSDFGPGSLYWSSLKLDHEVSIYMDGALSLGIDPNHCLYDVLGQTS